MTNVEKSPTVLLVILFVAGLAIGAGGAYFMAPTKLETVTETVTVTKHPLEGVTVPIGFICSDTSRLETESVTIKDIVVPELNDYAKKLGYDVNFEILVDDAQSQAAIHLEKVQAFKTIDVNLMIAGEWSSQAQAALSYVNENNMFMLSPSSTSPLLAIADDNLYRLCPNDLVGAPIVADILWSWGIEAVVVFQRGDAWADGLYNILEIEFPKRGGVILERIRYATEVTEFSSYLATTDDILGEAIETYGVEHVGVVFFALVEASVIVTQVVDYPKCYSVIWMGTEDIGRRQRVIDDAGEAAIPLKCFGSLIAPSASWKWEAFEDRYQELTKMAPSFYAGVLVDCGFTIATSVLETASTDPLDVIEIFPDVCSNYFGVTGWCDLDETGDRKPGLYETWGYAWVDGKPGFIKFAEVDAMAGKVNWDLEALQSEGLIPPGH